MAGRLLALAALWGAVGVALGAFGAVAPLGGVAMIAGWLALAWGAWRSRTTLA